MFFVHPKIQLIRNPFLLLKAAIKPVNFELLNERLSRCFPNKQFVFTKMGRDAFELIVKEYNLKEGEIIMPAFICDTFYPTLKQYHIKPVFLDIDPDTFNIKLGDIERAITPRTKAILINYTYGLPISLQNLHTNVLMIEDLSHSFGAKINHQYTGAQSDLAFLSLSKQFPTYKGGIAILPKGATGFAKNTLPKKFINLFSFSLKHFEQKLEKRIKTAKYFQGKLQELGFKTQKSQGNIFTYLTTLLPDDLKDKRYELFTSLKNQGVKCSRVWHQPIILNPKVQQDYLLDSSKFPNTINAAKKVLNFPLQNRYTEKHVDRMIETLKLVLDEIRA